jgi:putative peptide zinc metalloprotease protein
MGFIFGRPVAIARHSRHNARLILFGILSMAALWGFAGFMAYGLFHALEPLYHGAGVALFLAVIAYASFSLWRQGAAKKAAQASKHANKQVLSARSQAGAGPSASGRAMQYNRGRTAKKARPWGRYLLYIVVLVVLFLPYRYESGGNSEIFPAARVTVTVDTDGILEKVNFSGGEQVKAGTVLARIADYNQYYSLRMLEADIESQKYKIKQYQTTPSAEDIKLAEEKIRTASLQAIYSEEKLKRQEGLVSQGFISPQALADVRSLSIHDKQALDEAVASLDSIKSQVNPYQIQSLIADLMKMQRQAEYDREKLRRTQLISPIDGKIATTDLQYLRNSFLKAGTKFADVEDTQSVILRISVPEADIGDLSIGAPITLKLSAYPDREFVGKVKEISPVAAVTSTTDTSHYLQVSVVLDNSDGLLRTGFTGSAKIVGKETVALLAYTRALYRFVTIQTWSWLP